VGKRGIGARRKGGEQAQSTRKKPFPWENAKLPMSERFFLFAESLPISSGKLAGQKLRLRDWQKDMLRPVFDRQIDGKRVIRTALFSFPRKQGKTQIAAVLALAFLCGPLVEERGQIYSAASDRNQAGLVFKELCAIIDRVPWMTDRLNIRKQIKVVEDETTGSFYEALSSDARKAHGLSPSCIIADEIAQWRGRDLWDNLVSGTGAREQPLIVAIGTQSDSDENLMSELVDYAEKVNKGDVEDATFHGVVYAAPPDADPWNPATWAACNPALRDFKDFNDMKTQADQARRIPARIGPFKNLQLNMRISAEVRFIPPEDWNACGEPVNATGLYGRPCFAGLDLSSTQDLTAAVLYFPEDGGAVIPFYWLPKDNIRMLEETGRVPYRAWQEQGLIELTPGRAVDYHYVARKLAQVASDYDLKGIAYDRWRIKAFERVLVEEGVSLPLVEWGQGFKDMAPAVDALEAAVLDGRIMHGGNPILRWNCSNCVVEQDAAGNRKLSKKRSREKIDGAVSLAMAIGLAAKEEVKPIFRAEDILLLEF
jgi:phage terminase large subunit-like protein